MAVSSVPDRDYTHHLGVPLGGARFFQGVKAMGLGGISLWQLGIILLIVLLLFGSKRLGSLGSDLGAAIKGFRSSVRDDDSKAERDESTA
jgi:sec-independent protein translocase protein TatA